MGAEVNIMDETGRIDLPESTCRDLDIVIASIHPPCYGMGHTEEEKYESIRGCDEENRILTLSGILMTVVFRLITNVL
mgnify:CR=1 FL=1